MIIRNCRSIIMRHEMLDPIGRMDEGNRYLDRVYPIFKNRGMGFMGLFNTISNHISMYMGVARDAYTQP